MFSVVTAPRAAFEPCDVRVNLSHAGEKKVGVKVNDHLYSHR